MTIKKNMAFKRFPFFSFFINLPNNQVYHVHDRPRHTYIFCFIVPVFNQYQNLILESSRFQSKIS